MIISIAVSAAVALLVFLSVLLKPSLKLGRIEIGTYWLISTVGALILLLCGVIPIPHLFSELFGSASINPIKILILFFSMTALSVFLDEIGFFSYLANLALGKMGKNQTALFVAVYAVVSLLTVFTSNDIVVLTFTPFICLFSKNAKINPLPYLFAEFVASNTWSMILIIGNPTNIYLATSAGISFVSYFLTMALPTVFAGITSFLVLYLLFRKELKKEMHAEPQPRKIKNKAFLVLGVEHLALCTVLLAVSSYLHFEMYLVAMLFALSLFLFAIIMSLSKRKAPREIFSTVKRLPYELIPFVLSMFVLVLSLEYTGATEKLSALFVNFKTPIPVGILSFISSNVINNIPMSVLFGSIINSGAEAANYMQNVYAAVIGSNIGAFFTPVGALAGIMWASILRRFGVDFSFKKFVLYGAVISIPTLLAALFGLMIVL